MEKENMCLSYPLNKAQNKQKLTNRRKLKQLTFIKVHKRGNNEYKIYIEKFPFVRLIQKVRHNKNSKKDCFF